MSGGRLSRSDLLPAVGARRRRLLLGAWILCRVLGILMAVLPLTVAVIGKIDHNQDLFAPAALLTPVTALWSIPFFLAAARLRRSEPRGASLASKASRIFIYVGVSSLIFGATHEHRELALAGLSMLCFAAALGYVFAKSRVTLAEDHED
jgi:hypothetical protein